jgi:hypothetical protein
VRWPFPHGRATHLKGTFDVRGFKVEGENMTFTFPTPLNAAGSPSSVSGTVAPVTATDTPSQAVLSDLAFTSSDPTVFTVAADPSTPDGFIVTVVNTTATSPVQATHSYSALATNADGTTETVTGSDLIVVTPAAVVVIPIAPAASLVATYGSPA